MDPPRLRRQIHLAVTSACPNRAITADLEANVRGCIAIVFVLAAFGQSGATGSKFELASINPSSLRPSEVAAAGRRPGMRVSGDRVEFEAYSLLVPIATAYRTDIARITGPDWMSGKESFDRTIGILAGQSGVAELVTSENGSAESESAAQF